MKKAIKYFSLLMILLLLFVIDSVSYENLRSSLCFLLTQYLLGGHPASFILFMLYGALFDFLLFSFPFNFILILLLFGLCSYLKKNFLQINIKSVLIINFLSLFVFFASSYVVLMIKSGGFTLSFDIISDIFGKTFINSALVFPVYFCLKRLKV